jgi:formylmethanofuran dehydrogenase subunit E
MGAAAMQELGFDGGEKAEVLEFMIEARFCSSDGYSLATTKTRR